MENPKAYGLPWRKVVVTTWNSPSKSAITLYPASSTPTLFGKPASRVINLHLNSFPKVTLDWSIHTDYNFSGQHKRDDWNLQSSARAIHTCDARRGHTFRHVCQRIILCKIKGKTGPVNTYRRVQYLSFNLAVKIAFNWLKIWSTGSTVIKS